MHTLTLRPPTTPLNGHLRMGESEGPDRIYATSTHLVRGDRPWFPVMGEIHFTRYPRDSWREQLLSMRAGGIDVVSTYLFWHHHEENRGHFRFDGNRDLRAFLQVVAQCGLDAVVRIGPWSHGEARYGGFPEWVQHSGTRTRTDDPAYLELVQPYYARISTELDGLYHARGGPIVAVQIENELYDQPEHLRSLKHMAQDAGITPALWTATAWGMADLPADEFLPLYAGYPESPWDDAHPGWARHNRRHYFFTPLRDDHTVGADLRRKSAAGQGPALDRYPYATCELGGGVQVTYHRRPRIAADDVAALALTKIGCGSAWQGYYMYQGGSHVMDAATTMQESLDTGYPNDLPVVSYDFHAHPGRIRAGAPRLRAAAAATPPARGRGQGTGADAPRRPGRNPRRARRPGHAQVGRAHRRHLRHAVRQHPPARRRGPCRAQRCPLPPRRPGEPARTAHAPRRHSCRSLLRLALPLAAAR
ncbi:beta-galactosidase [Streptomyces sp. NPDC001780]